MVKHLLNIIIRGGYGKEAVEFMRNFMGNVFKGNTSLHKGIITGINRIAKENIFSGLNNLKVDTVFDDKYAEFFGITEPELKTMLKYCNMNNIDDIKSWYDGYNIGGCELYNPWSLTNYISDGRLMPYWVNTSSNDLIIECIHRGNNSFKNEMKKLIDGKTITVNIEKKMIYEQLNDSGNIWGLFMNAGYMTLENYDTDYKKYSIKIPNQEISDEFEKIIARGMNTSYSALNDTFDCLMNKRDREFIEAYKETVAKTMSYYDNKENAYHMFMLGMCVALRSAYTVKSNIEGGYGRTDITCIPKEKRYSPIIMEFKATGEDKKKFNMIDDNELENMGKEAIQQIKDNKYYADFVNEGYKECILLGIAHHKKQSEVVMERMQL